MRYGCLRPLINWMLRFHTGNPRKVHHLKSERSPMKTSGGRWGRGRLLRLAALREVRKTLLPERKVGGKKTRTECKNIIPRAAFRLQSRRHRTGSRGVKQVQGRTEFSMFLPHASSSLTGVPTGSRAGRMSAHYTPRRARRTVWRDL